jgi:hypothetical protein
MTIGTTQVQPGEYELKAEEGESKLTVVQQMKVVATVPIQWTTLPNKSQGTQIIADGSKVTEVHFGGTAASATISQ